MVFLQQIARSSASHCSVILRLAKNWVFKLDHDFYCIDSVITRQKTVETALKRNLNNTHYGIIVMAGML